MSRESFILAGGLVDGSGAGVRRNVFMAVRDGTISAVGPAADLAADARAGAVDLSHAVLLPALVDGSVRLTGSAALAGDGAAGPVARNLEYCLAHGVLGVAAVDGAVADASWPVEVRAAGRDYFRAACSAGIGEEDRPAAAPRRPAAGRGGMKTVALANGARAVAAAIAAGFDAIEQGYGMGRDNLARMAARGMVWFPALTLARNLLEQACGGGEVCCRFSGRYIAPGRTDAEMKALWERRLAEQLDLVALARELGVTVAVATGAGSPGIIHGEAVAGEVRLLIRAGYPLAGAIRCASVNGARFFGMEGPGPLTPGHRATFLVIRGTAGQVPRKLSYLEGVYINGEPAATLTSVPAIRP